MKVIPCGQNPDRPANAPEVIDPVTATLDVAVFYETVRGPILTSRTIFCARIFSATVLTTIEQWCKKYHFSLVSLGCYSPRYARHADGTPILPQRWSGHAYGAAIDMSGVEDSAGTFFRMDAFRDGSPEKYQELIAGCEKAMTAAGIHHQEIVIEPTWTHIGYLP
jgi:hypothetical protein